MSTHNICFYLEIRKNILLILLSGAIQLEMSFISFKSYFRNVLTQNNYFWMGL